MSNITKQGLIGLREAADYLQCSHQTLGKILGADDPHQLKEYFRFYAGRWRTTYALLDEFFTNNVNFRIGNEEK